MTIWVIKQFDHYSDCGDEIVSYHATRPVWEPPCPSTWAGVWAYQDDQTELIGKQYSTPDERWIEEIEVQE